MFPTWACRDESIIIGKKMSSIARTSLMHPERKTKEQPRQRRGRSCGLVVIAHAIKPVELPARLCCHDFGSPSPQHQPKALNPKQPHHHGRRRAIVAKRRREKNGEKPGFENLKIPPGTGTVRAQAQTGREKQAHTHIPGKGPETRPAIVAVKFRARISKRRRSSRYHSKQLVHCTAPTHSGRSHQPGALADKS